MTDDNPVDEFEKLGEEEVRRRLARGEYGHQGLRRNMVDDWLAGKAHSRIASQGREMVSEARSSKRAAWVAAIAAVIATVCAILTVGGYKL
ncbi:MAG: hypothetical protein AB7M05_14925 [Alphaproteobacteria bacterium]